MKRIAFVVSWFYKAFTPTTILVTIFHICTCDDITLVNEKSIVSWKYMKSNKKCVFNVNFQYNISQFTGMSPALVTYSKSTPTLVGCQFPGISPALVTYSKSTPTLLGSQFPGMSPALITYSKSTPTLVGCQFPGMSPALINNQVWWHPRKLTAHKGWCRLGERNQGWGHPTELTAHNCWCRFGESN
jgi:hypothetical protein